MFWDKFSNKERLGLFIGVAFMAFAFADRLIIVPFNNHMKKLDRQIEASQKELALVFHNTGQKGVLLDAYDKYVPREKGPRTDEERIAVMLTAVEDLGRDSGISLLDIKPQPTKTTAQTKEFSISVEAEGEMEKLVTFLYKLSTSSELLRVESLRVNLKDKNSPTVKASIVISKIALL